MTISKTAKIQEIEKSWKFEGFCFITLSNGQIRKRKCYDRKTGDFAGRTLVNLDTDIYSFKWDNSFSPPHGYDIQWVGNYKSIEEAIKAKKNESKAEVEEEQPKKEPVTPEAKPIVVVEEGEVRHEKYQQILTCVSADIPVYLYGPAGSGKNHTLQQIAETLGLEFFFTNSVQQEYKITGFIDAGGTFHETEFYKAFTRGGLFFLDEMDASIPEVLVLLNAALANKYFEFPNGKVTAHKDFRVVAAGNTVGSGADESYTGRLQLDQATLDRFALLEFDYSEKIEMALAKGNKELVSFVRGLRKQAKEKGIRATFSYRCIISVVKLEGKLTLKDIITIAVMKGFDKDTINTFSSDFSKYGIALADVKRGA